MPIPPSVAPLVLQADDAEVRLHFAGQLQGQLDVTPAPAALAARLRRLRLGLDGKALDEQLRFGLQLNVAPGATELLDAWAGWAPRDDLQLRAGLFKTPFTRYRDQSYQALLLVDWPVAAKAFGAERQLGLALGDGRPGQRGLGWAVGVFTGTNSRKAFATGVADANGVALDNPSDLATGTGAYALHPELVGRITAGTPGMQTGTTYDHEGGTARALVGASAAWDLDPDPTVEFTGRGALEALLKLSHASVDAVGYLGLGEDGAPAAVGGTAELAVVPTPRLGLAVVGSRVDVLPGLPDAVLDQTAELGGGGTWFVHGTGLDLALDAAWLHTVREGVAVDGARVRLQAQLAL
ncbi:MAG: porin [Myxococcota bacterium]